MSVRAPFARTPEVLIAVAWLMSWIAVPTGASDEYVMARVDFNADTPGQPPATGGPNQPTTLHYSPGTSIIVQTSANGIATQPVVVTTPSAGVFASVKTDFFPIGSGIARIEAVVSFDRLVDGFFLQTTAGTGQFPSAVVTRLITTRFGQIEDDVSRTTIGMYSAGHPFGIRMDVDMTLHHWTAVADPELDGFDDNFVSVPLPFGNPVGVLPTVGAVWASLSLFPTDSAGLTSVAYDDIRAVVPGVVPTASTSWGRVKTLYR